MKPEVKVRASMSNNSHPPRRIAIVPVRHVSYPEIHDRQGPRGLSRKMIVAYGFRASHALPLLVMVCALVMAGMVAPADLMAGGGSPPEAEAQAAETVTMLAQLEEGDIDQSFEAYGDDSDEMIESDEPVMQPVDSLIAGIVWLGHAGFLIETDNKIYIDPYDIPAALADSLPKADLILITHDHSDHFSPGDIARIIKPSTVVVSIRPVIEDLPDEVKTSRTVGPGDTVTVNGILIEAVPAYNIEKKFHPRDKGYVGFVIHLDGRTIYHAGDTDLIPEMEKIETDVALLPIGGKFTMDALEAARAAEVISPKVAIPMHWGKIIGTWEDAKQFQAMCETQVVVLPEITGIIHKPRHEAP